MWYVNVNTATKENKETIDKLHEKGKILFSHETLLKIIPNIVNDNTIAYIIDGTDIKVINNTEYYETHYGGDELIKKITGTVIHEELHEVLYRIAGNKANKGFDNIDIWHRISEYNL